MITQTSSEQDQSCEDGILGDWIRDNLGLIGCIVATLGHLTTYIVPVAADVIWGVFRFTENKFSTTLH